MNGNVSGIKGNVFGAGYMEKFQPGLGFQPGC